MQNSLLTNSNQAIIDSPKSQVTFQRQLSYIFINLKNDNIMESLLATFIGGAIAGLIYQLSITLENKRKNK